ncbi:MAG TPA: class IV adenylate cyclase [Bryobacteraceae bacterium]|nr:class IV adenylate cyclase [Bryobacteraceae bacterium]
MTGSHPEVEVKLALSSPEKGRQLLAAHRFEVAVPRLFEVNVIYDTPSQELRSAGSALRLRKAGEQNLLTLKGPSTPGKHKTRPESEVEVSSFEVTETLLAGLGYTPRFRYEKYRTEYTRQDDNRGIATLDETPIGTYLELEGDPDWIDLRARELGFQESDYVTESYASLYLLQCQSSGATPSNMVFDNK